jgi:GGDEF domain-containing protein
MARLWGNIASMLGIRGQTSATGAAGQQGPAASADPTPRATEPVPDGRDPAQPEPTAPQEAATRVEFGQRLSTLASYGGAISAGRVKLINLEELKREFGPRWSEVAPRVAVTISSTLKNRLGPRDAFIRLDEAHFVLLFGTHDGERAAAICSLIAAEIKQKLFGIERDLGAMKLATATVEVDGQLKLDPIDPLATLTSLLDAAPSVTEHRGSVEDAASRSKKEPDWREVRIPRESGAEDGPRAVPIKISPRALNDLIKTLGLAIGDWRQPDGPAEHVIFDGADMQRQIADSARRQETLRQIEAAAAGMTVPLAPAGDASPDKTERDLIVSQLRGANFRYQPIWHRETQAITSYGLNLRFLVGDAQLSVNELMDWESDPEIVVAVDLLMAKKALADLASMLRQGTKAIFSLPLHRAVLDMPVARAQLLALLTAAPVPMRQLILLDILDAYAGDWTLLPALVAGLRRVSREVVLRLPLDHTDFSRVLAAGAHTVGGDLREHAWPHARAMRGLADFGKAARSAGLKSYVLGINTPPLAIAAIAAGFDYLAGGAVSPEVPQPVGVVPLDAAQLSRGASANRSLKG